MFSKTNSLKHNVYKFQPTKYDKDGNLYCKLMRKDCCKLTGLYHFDTGKFDIIFLSEGWLNHNHKNLLEWIFKQYDWDFENFDYSTIIHKK